MTEAETYLHAFFEIDEDIDITIGTTLLDSFQYYNNFCNSLISDGTTFDEFAQSGESIGDVAAMTPQFAQFVFENNTIKDEFNEGVNNGRFYGVVVVEILSELEVLESA